MPIIAPADQTEAGLDHLWRVVRPVLVLAPPGFIDEIRVRLADAGIQAAVAWHDSGSIYDWLMTLVALQGISDEVAYVPPPQKPLAFSCLRLSQRHKQLRRAIPPTAFSALCPTRHLAFCAAGGLDICNGNRVDDRHPCRLCFCPIEPDCERVALRSSTPTALKCIKLKQVAGADP